jgi:transposase
MARYKAYDLNQAKMIPISYSDQVVEGSFEHALNEIVEEHLDLSAFERRYANDATGRLAYDPKVLLKIVLYGYYKGIISSRALAEACRRNVVFMALSADTRPHFTTLAVFVSELDREIVSLFRDVLLYASELGLVGKEHFAVDGCKLPSNASKKWSGTHRELEDKLTKLERVAERIVMRHRERDALEKNSEAALKDVAKAERYRCKVAQLKTFLETNKKKQGPSGNEQKSNLTDPESAKMSSSRGVLQGYNGLAVVDDRSQIVVHAEAHGSGYEGHLLAPIKRRLFTLNDFHYDESKALCICPAGHKLYQSGKDMLFNGYRVDHFKAPITACRDCTLRAQCLRYPERTIQRQLTVIKHREGAPKSRARKDAPTERMRWKFDSPAGRAIYSRRMATVEPVFANLQNKGMRRFTLRGRRKVNAQWQLFTIVHNIEKIAHRGARS